MKKNLLLTLLALPMICMGELFLEITKGSDNPFKVAIIPFAGSPKVSKPLHQIIQNDLDRTGEFSLLDSKLLLPLIKTDEEINYKSKKVLYKNCKI